MRVRYTPERMAEGLTAAEAARRLAETGPNEPVAPERSGVWLQLVRRFANPLVAILVLASLASAAVRDFGNAAIILLIVASSIVIELVQTRRSQRVAEALRARVAETAAALRDGEWARVPRREIVPDDMVRLVAGDMIPADARVLQAKDLHVVEAALTGESLPVEKERGAPLLMGSSVVSGTATAVVTATGEKTQFGAIARAIARRPPQTEFEHGIVRFGVFIL